MDAPYLSVSRLQTFRICNYQFKLKYHDKIPSPFDEKKFFTYGKIIHKIGQLYVENKGQTPIENIVKEVIGGKIPIDRNGECAKGLPIEYQRKLPEHIRSLKSITDKIGFDKGFTEYEFFYDMDKPNGHYLKGYIDRIIIKKDKIFILDYKTTKNGRWQKNQQSVLDDLQLMVYCMIVQKQFGAAAENINAALYYLDNSKLVGATYSQKSLDNIEKQMLESYLEIKAMPPEAARGTVGNHCKFCDYRPSCPFYSLT